MLLFIIIFFAMVIIVGATAIFGFSFYLKRRTKSFPANEQKQFAGSPPRSLFEPDADELRAIERENEKQLLAKIAADERRLKAEKAENVRALREKWRVAPNGQATAELLRAAAGAESAEIFSETAENVIELWRKHRIESLTAPDLADLLDSHFRLLPQQERTSGAIFWVKREIEKLRSQSEENK